MSCTDPGALWQCVFSFSDRCLEHRLARKLRMDEKADMLLLFSSFTVMSMDTCSSFWWASELTETSAYDKNPFKLCMRTITSLVTMSGVHALWVILHQGKKKISMGWDEEGCSIKQDYTRAMRMGGCEWVRHRAGWRRLRTCRGSWSGEVGKMQMAAWFEMMNLNQRRRVKMRNREGSGNDLLDRRHHDHSLGSEGTSSAGISMTKSA